MGEIEASSHNPSSRWSVQGALRLPRRCSRVHCELNHQRREEGGREMGGGGRGGMTVIHIILIPQYLYNNDVTYYVIT